MDKKVNKQNLKAKLIVVILIIILIGILICLLNYDYISAKKKLKEINNVNEVAQDIYIPDGILRVTNLYEGDVESYKVVLKSLEYTSKVIIPKYIIETRDMSDDDLKQYYKSKEKIIKMEIGIEEVDEFIDFAKALKDIKGDSFTIKDYNVDITSVSERFNRVEAIMNFEYEEGQTVRLKIVLEQIIHKYVSPLKYMAPDIQKNTENK